MTTSIAVTILALTTAYLFIWKKNNDHSAQSLEARAYEKTLGIQIVCGNCAGDGEIAIRTFLGINGNCSKCAGNSFVPASTLGVYALLARQAQMYGNQAHLYETETGVDTHSGRVISLKDHLALREERVEKLAS